jgi:hypothetical protein
VLSEPFMTTDSLDAFFADPNADPAVKDWPLLDA